MNINNNNSINNTSKTTVSKKRKNKSSTIKSALSKTAKKRVRPHKINNTSSTTVSKKRKSSSNKTAKKRVTQHKSLNTDLFGIYPTDVGESVVESYLSVLISLMGGIIGETYVTDVLGVDMVKTKYSTKPGNDLIPGKSAIYYGKNENATHFTATTDGIELWDSYKRGIQMRDTHNFCQTFSIMYINNYKKPHTNLGKAFLNLKKGEYMDNAYIAKTYACDVLKYMDKYFNYNEEMMCNIINDEVMFLYKGKKMSDVRGTFNLKEFANRCKKITKDEMCNSSFKESIFNLIN